MGLRLMNKEILPPDEAQRIGLRFIQSKYYGAKVTIDHTELVTEGAFPVYRLGGNIKMRSHGWIGGLVYKEKGFTFEVQVHALEGSILGYELA